MKKRLESLDVLRGADLFFLVALGPIIEALNSATKSEWLGKQMWIFSHVEWHMTGYTVVCESESADYIWVTPDELRFSYAVPTAFRAFLKQIL